MSLTSCYRYIIELPSATLNEILHATLSEDEGAGLGLTQHWEDLVIGGFTADVDVRPADQDENPSTLTLTADPLGVSLHMAVRVEVAVQDVPSLEDLVYMVAFDLIGVFEKTAEALPRLVMTFPGVTQPGLNLSVTGGGIPLTPELIEPYIHELYDSNPDLGHQVLTGISLPGIGQVAVDLVIHDDEPMGVHITVRVDSPAKITLIMPGHMRVYNISNANIIDSDITVEVGLDVIQADGSITVKLLNAVQAADVTVTFASPNTYTPFAGPIMAIEIAEIFSDFNDFVQEFPTNAQLTDLIASRILEMASELAIPVFTPAAPLSGDEIDLTAFTPATLNQQALALQLEPLEDGTPCDTPDVFVGASGFAIAIAAPEVDRMMAPIVDNNVGGHHVEGYDVTVQNLSAVLSDPGEHGQPGGHIWIDGQVEVHVDCWADPEIDFWGPVTLVPAMRVDGTLVFTADAGSFGADDPCCGDVDPAQIANLIEGEESTPIRMPTDFVGVGSLELAVTSADISKAGIVIHGTLGVITTTMSQLAHKRKSVYWITENSGGG